MKISILTIAALCVCNMAVAQSSGTPIKMKMGKPQGGDRPKSPGKDVSNIMAFLEDNVLTIIFEEDEGPCNIIVYDEHSNIIDELFASTEWPISIFLNVEAGQYNVILDTEKSNYYCTIIVANNF